MTENADGTATCDRCGLGLPGYGVIFGMVISDITGDLIVCYNCRPAVLAGLVNHSGTERQCSHCGVEVAARVTPYASLVTDLAPGVDPPTGRQLLFCVVNGSRDLFLARLTI